MLYKFKKQVSQVSQMPHRKSLITSELPSITGVQFIKKAPSLQPIIAHAVTSKSEEVNVKNTILKYA